jgi:hypothetical protein
MTEGMSDYRLAGGCCAAFSLLFALGALALAGWSLSQSLGTRRVAATVVAIDRHIDWDSNGHEVTIHTPVAEYEVAGRTYRCRGMGVSRPSLTHEVGDPVAVLYRVAEPSTGHIDSFVDRWLAAARHGACRDLRRAGVSSAPQTPTGNVRPYFFFSCSFGLAKYT